MSSGSQSETKRGQLVPTQVWVVVERDGRGWHAYTPRIRGIRTEGATIAEALRGVRRQVAGMFAGNTTPFEVISEVRFLAAAPKRAVERAHSARAAARRAEIEATTREGEAARFLARRGMVPADIAVVLRLPVTRVRALVG